MDTIARTKPDISVLRKDILPVSPFGILSQAFTEEILGRFESGPGMYPMYGLELLYPEENAGEALAGGNVQLEVQLKLILQQLKESGRTPAAERILEKAETLRLLREKTAVRWRPGAPGKAAAHRNPVAMGQPPSAGAFLPQPGGVGITRGQSGARYMTVHAGIGRMNQGSYWPKMYAESATGMENRQPGTHIGTASGGNEKRPSAALARMGSPTVAGLPGQMGLSLAEVQFLMPQETAFSGRQPMEYGKAAAGLTRQMEQAAAQAAETVARVVAIDSKGAEHHRRLGRVPSNAERYPQRSDRLPTEQTHREAGKNTTGDGVTGNHAFAGMTTEQGSVDVTVTGGETASWRSSPKERLNGDPDIGRFGPTARDIRTGGGRQFSRLPDTELKTSGAAGYVSALRQDKAPGVEGAAAAPGYLPMPLEHMQAESISEQTAIPGQTAPAGGAMKQIVQAMEAAVLVEERTFSGAAADHPSTGTTVNYAPAGTTVNHLPEVMTVTGGETPGGHSSAKERTNSGPDVGRIGPTARDIRTSGGRQFSGLSDRELTTSGAAGHVSALRQDKAPGVEGVAAAPGYLPMSLEHMGPVDVSEQAVISGRMSTFNETERQLSRMIETAAFAAERPLTQTAGEARGKRDPVAERKSETYGESAKTLAGKTAAPFPQATGMSDANALQTTQMKQTGPLVKDGEKTVKSATMTARRDRHATSGPGVLHDLEKLAVSRTAGDTDNTHYGTDSGLAVDGHIATELAGRPPVALEYLQESEKSDMQASEQVLSPKIFEKLLDTPELRLLSKDISVLAVGRWENLQTPSSQSRYSPRKGQLSHHWSQAAKEITGHAAQVGGVTKGMTVGGATTAAPQDHIRSTAAPLPVELAHMEPSLEVQMAGQTVARQRLGVQQETLLKEIQRSLAASKSSIVGPGQNTAQSQAQAKQIASGRKTAVSPMRAGRRGSAGRGLGQLTALKPLGAFPRGTGTILNAVQGTTAQREMDQETTSAYPALSMEYGGPLLAMAKELRQTAERELGQSGAAREMGLHTPAARAIEEKGMPETMHTLDLMTQPQIQAQQVVWENPYMRSAPAEMTHHQKKNPQNQQRTQQSQPQIRMSDAEIRRAADKVFKLVQEKIVTERRRIGRM